VVNQSGGLWAAVIFDLFSCAFIQFQRKLIARRHSPRFTGQFKPKIIELGAWRYPATAFVGLVLFVLDVVPLPACRPAAS